MKRKLSAYFFFILISTMGYFYVRKGWIKEVKEDSKELRKYKPLRIENNLNLEVNSVYLSKASFYISSTNQDSIRVDAYDFLDYRNKDYSHVIRPSYSIWKESKNDTLWIKSNSGTTTIEFLVIDKLN